MQAEQFQLANSEVVILSPGLLEVRAAGGAIVRSHTLGAARGVQRNGHVVQVQLPEHGLVTLEAVSTDDAVAVERALRTAILAAPDGGWDDLFADAPAATPPMADAPTTPTSPQPQTPLPAPSPVSSTASDAPAVPPAASAPATQPTTRGNALANRVVLASGYAVEVTPQQVLVRHQLGHVVSELPRSAVLAASRAERTVTLQTSGGVVNLIAASEQDAARLLGLVDGSHVAPVPAPASAPASAAPPTLNAAPVRAMPGQADAVGAWAPAGVAGAADGATNAVPDIAPWQFRLPSGYRVSIATEWVVVHTAMGNVANSVPMADVLGAEAQGATVHLRTTGEQFNFVTASPGDAQALATTINTSRRLSPHPPPVLPMQQGTPAKQQGIPGWAIAAAVIIGFIIFGNLLG